jgi:hypothetical protein
MMGTHFFDLHSGGGQKLEFASLWVDLPEDKAIEWFQETFDRHPHSTTCDCCGEDYAVYEQEKPNGEERIVYITSSPE